MLTFREKVKFDTYKTGKLEKEAMSADRVSTTEY